MKLKNATLFECAFSFKKKKENHSLKRKIEADLSSHHQWKDDELDHVMNRHI